MKYRVKLIYKYSDVVHVESDNAEDAIVLAMAEAVEQYESFYDAEVSEEE